MKDTSSEMNVIIDFFKGIVNWILGLMKKEGAKRTITAIVISIVILFGLTLHQNQIVYKVGKECDQKIQENIVEQFENHQGLWLESRDLYMKTKAIMRRERPVTQADYILFLEYHNGSENIATGYAFCKFDVSIGVRSDSVPALPIEDFRDETIWRWDMLLTDEVIHHKMVSITLEESLKIDPEMLSRIHPNDHTQFIVFYNVMIDNICAGTLMFMYADASLVNYSAVTTCGSEIESLMNSAYKRRLNELKSKN